MPGIGPGLHAPEARVLPVYYIPNKDKIIKILNFAQNWCGAKRAPVRRSFSVGGYYRHIYPVRFCEAKLVRGATPIEQLNL